MAESNPRKMRFKNFIGRVRRSDFDNLPAFFHGSLFSWLMILGVAVAAVLLSTTSIQRIPANLSEGMIASHNIKADRNYEIVDEDATGKFREEAESGVLPVYDFDERVGEAIIKRIHDAFFAARERQDLLSSRERPGRGGANAQQDDEQIREIENAFSEKAGVTLSPAQWSVLLKERFGEHFEASLVQALRRVMFRPVVAERGSLDAGKGRGIIIRKMKAEGTPGEGSQYEESILSDVTRLASTEEARQQIAKMAVSPYGFRDKESPAAVISLAELLVEPNCALNLTEIERRKADAASSVKSAILKVKAGEMIIREGSRYELWHIKVLKGIQKEKRRGVYSMEFAGTLLLILLFIIVPFYLAERFFTRVKVLRSDHFLMAATGLVVLALMRLLLLLIPAVHDSLFFNVTTSSLDYAIPVAGGVMLLRMFLGAEITLVFAVAISAVTGFFVETDAGFVAYCLVSNLVAMISIANADRRGQILKAGAITGVVGAVCVLGIKLAGMASGNEPATLSEISWSLVFAFMGGMGSAIFTMIAAPIVESVSGYVSDIKLLELANLNHPLLRELIVRAPGTYHHSHLVGILGEAAAEAIGANALLVRVGAYYHDIGKMKKPLYFIENARSGENRHNRLSPNMSALIVAAHVKDGVDMATAAGLPKVIVAMIPEHQGTRLISYFYEKAKEQEKPDVQKVDEKEFMYPGPKPQTREAAILMLADAVEAAVRSLKEKSTTRIQQTVQRVITDIFSEKQLDDCDLTLKDLNDIARAFMRILIGIYHVRIEYPKETENEKPEVSIVDESSTATDGDDKPSSENSPAS